MKETVYLPGGDKPATGRSRLIVAAEYLFSQHGIDGVSMREVVAAAGYVNPGMATYYFSSKSELIIAIMERRMADFEGDRVKYISQYDALNPKDRKIDILLEGLWRPYLNVRDKFGNFVYARFIAELYSNGKYTNRFTMIDYTRNEFPALFSLLGRFRRHLRHIPYSAVQRRVQTISAHFTATLLWWEEQKARGEAVPPLEETVNDAISMASAALQLPFRSSHDGCG